MLSDCVLNSRPMIDLLLSALLTDLLTDLFRGPIL